MLAELGARLRAQQPAPLPLGAALVALTASAPARVLRGDAPRLLPWLLQVGAFQLAPFCAPCCALSAFVSQNNVGDFPRLPTRSLCPSPLWVELTIRERCPREHLGCCIQSTVQQNKHTSRSK